LRRQRSFALSKIALASVLIIIIVVVALGAFVAYYLETTHVPDNNQPLIVYSADAYTAETSAFESAFTNTTGIQAAPPKSGGSLTLAQEIAQGNPASVFVSVSKTAVQSSTLRAAFPGWAIGFAGDQMTLALSNLTNSAASKVVSAFNQALNGNSSRAWYNFYSNLTSGTVKVGISNPNSDPAGFRAWIVLEAAGQIYANDSTFFVNRLISDSGNVTAESAADLVAPLETGQIQFLFTYRSEAMAQKLGTLQLPPVVNLGDPSYNSFYSRFSYRISSGVQVGGAIILYVTVPKNAASYSNSLQFVAYMIHNYQTILKPFGLTPIVPAKLYNDTSSIPSQVQQLLAQGLLAYGGTL